MLSSSISTIVKKGTRALQGKDTENSNIKYEDPMDSIHDPKRRPVDVIQTDAEAEEDEKHKAHDEDSVQETGQDFKHEFDEASLSTHDSYHQVPIPNIQFDTEKRNFHSGLDPILTDQDDDTLDQIRMQAEAFLDDQKKKNAELQNLLQQDDTEITLDDDDDNPKISNEELPFDCDGSLLSSSTLDGILRAVRDGREDEMQPGIVIGTASATATAKSATVTATATAKVAIIPDALNKLKVADDVKDSDGSENEVKKENSSDYDTPGSSPNNDDKNIDGEAFADLGKLMFKKQRNRLNSQGDISLTPSEKEDADVSVPFDEVPLSLAPGTFVKGIKYKSKTVLGIFITCSPQLILLGIMLGSWAFMRILRFMFGVESDNIVAMDIVVDEEAEMAVEQQHNCSEETFHYAMYHLANVCAQPEPILDQGYSIVHIGTTAFMTAVFVAVTWILCNMTSKKPADKEKMSILKKGSNRSRTPSKPKLQREVNSLEKQNIFPSSFVTDIVSPKGSIESVKRSSRIVKLSSSKKQRSASMSDVIEEESDIIKVKSALLADFDGSTDDRKVKKEMIEMKRKVKVKAEL